MGLIVFFCIFFTVVITFITIASWLCASSSSNEELKGLTIALALLLFFGMLFLTGYLTCGCIEDAIIERNTAQTDNQSASE